ncbi:hypothetical protein [Falsiroseomonas tokyonensis]|uniref:Uncharacterized protein n=1 Tax=Falsiroseomonas tokyonensis TaxID=430521 RepID=A0ABV7BYX8_9PROT|nr:hypothetical protein [Falsiroseomonas tokyonensis]MBU8540845.1 hypothetical protein [Falsiroseomonas tokyonensis]
MTAIQRPLVLVVGWRGEAIRARDALMQRARESHRRGQSVDAGRHLAEARLAHRAAMLGLLRRAAA